MAACRLIFQQTKEILNMSVTWLESDLGLSMRVLANSQSVKDARKVIGDVLDRKVTSDALTNAFRRAGLGKPGDYLSDDGIPSDWGPMPTFRAESMADKQPVMQSSKLHRILVIGDCHHPYVDKMAWALMLKAARAFKPDTLVVMGDFVDLYSVSAHSKNPARVTQMGVEIDAANKALDQLDTLGATRKEFLAGNHENRLERYLSDKAPELFDSVKIEDLLELKGRGWAYTAYRQHIKIGKVHYVHDVGNAGANAHVQAGAAFQSSAVIGHVHRLACTYSGNVLGETHVAIAAGWLGDRDAADYMYAAKAMKDWHQGFVTGFMENDGTTHLTTHPIINGRVCLHGELISAD